MWAIRTFHVSIPVYWSRSGRNVKEHYWKFTWFYVPIYAFWVVLHLYLICAPINTNPHFQEISAVVATEIYNVNKFVLITTAIIQPDIKSEYLFRTCSVATNMVTSHSDLCLYAVPFLANYGTVPYSLVPTPIAGLLQAVLQKNAEPVRNGPVEMRNSTV